MEAFLGAFGLIFLMEMGDKSQLVIMALAARYHWRQVALGLVLAAAATHGLAVLVGGVLGTLIPLIYVKTLAALAFLGFALWTLWSNQDDEAEDKPNGGLSRWPALAIAAAFFVCEFGDKTQLATVAAVARTGQPFQTWLGAVLGMLLADVLGIGLGRLLRRIPQWIITWVSSSVFAVCGWSTLVEAWEWPFSWLVVGLAFLLLVCFVVTRRHRQSESIASS
ncbi:MAG: TMEM165/GDT1 family protein [Firmicutes bacterium]|nr:TMEM165/GDT1 family protein [Bacillota bacterium]